MGVHGQGEKYLSHGPENDNDNAIRKINNKYAFNEYLVCIYCTYPK